METSANTRRGLAALIVKGGGGKSAAPAGAPAGELIGSADPGGEGAEAASAANDLEATDPYVELATEALEAFQANDATALAAIFRAVRGMPEDDSKTTG